MRCLLPPQRAGQTPALPAPSRPLQGLRHLHLRCNPHGSGPLALDRLVFEPPSRLFPHLESLDSHWSEFRYQERDEVGAPLPNPARWVAAMPRLQRLEMSMAGAPGEVLPLPPALTSLDMNVCSDVVRLRLDSNPHLQRLRVHGDLAGVALLASAPAQHLTADA